MGHTTPIMWGYIDAGDKKSVKELFNVIISTTEPEQRRELYRKQENIY
jgi:hypothetical protein